MDKNSLTRHELFSLLSLFFLGSAAVLGGISEAGRASWLAMIIAFAAGCALILLYLQICAQKNSVFGTFLSCFSPKIAVFFATICAVFAIYSSAITISIFLNFTSEAELLTAPKLFIAVFLAITLFFMLRGSISGLGRFAAVIWPISAIFMIASISLAISACDFAELWGIVDAAKLAAGAYSGTVLPYGEAFFAILLLAPCVSGKKARTLGTYSATALCFGLMLATLVKNLCALGLKSMEIHNFPSFTVSGMVPLGSFFQRFEIFIAMNFLICVVFKAVIFLLFAREVFFEMIGSRKAERAKSGMDFALCAVLAVMASIGGAIMLPTVPALFAHLQNYKYIMTFPVIILPIMMFVLQKVRQKLKR